MAQHIAEVYEAKYQTAIGQDANLAVWHEAVLSYLETLDTQKKLLDVGCGNGRLLAAIVDLGFDAVGIDVSSEAVALCREKGLSAECVDIDTVGIPYQEVFDICTSTEVIEHVFDPYRFLAQINSSLKDGGMLVLTAPNFGYYLWQWRYLLGESPSQIQSLTHIRFFTASYLQAMAVQQGFIVRQMYGPVRGFRWAKTLSQKLTLQSLWVALTRRWGKSLFAILEKVGPPRYADLAQASYEGNS